MILPVASIRTERQRVIHIGLSRDETQQVVDLIQQLDAAADPAAANQRLSPRADFCHPMWLNIPMEPGTPWVHVFSRNLSSGGLSFLSRRDFPQDQCLILSHALDADDPQLALCAVRFNRQITNSIFEIGLEFLARMPDPDVKRVIPQRWLSIIDRNAWAVQHGAGRPASKAPARVSTPVHP